MVVFSRYMLATCCADQVGDGGGIRSASIHQPKINKNRKTMPLQAQVFCNRTLVSGVIRIIGGLLEFFKRFAKAESYRNSATKSDRFFCLGPGYSHSFNIGRPLNDSVYIALYIGQVINGPAAKQGQCGQVKNRQYIGTTDLITRQVR